MAPAEGSRIGSIDNTAESNDIAAESIDIATGSIDIAAESIDIATGSIDIAAESIDIAAESIDIATGSIDIVAGSIDIVAGSIDVVTESNDIATESNDNAAKSNDNAAESNDNAAKSNDNAAKSNDGVAPSNDIVAPSNDKVVVTNANAATSIGKLRSAIERREPSLIPNPLSSSHLVRLGLILLAALALVGVTGTALAQTAPPPALRLNKYSVYEHDTIDDALEYLHAIEDKEPEGKIVEGIDIITLEVFEKRDLVPGVTSIFNVFHATTKRYVIEREVLLRPGEPFRQSLVDDSIRNLRNLVQLSVVLTLATKGSEPGRVRLVVITKDVWSLRPNWDIQASGAGLQSLYAKPAEINLAGTHQTVSGTFFLQPNSLLLGGGYANPRLLSTHLNAQAEADIILNLPTGRPEGSQGYLIVGKPLYSPRVDWAWDAQAVWSDQVQRRYVNAALGCYVPPSTPSMSKQGGYFLVVPFQVASPSCAQREMAGSAVPFAYRATTFETQYTLTRSYGWTTKHDIALGVQVNAQRYPSTPVELETAFPAGAYNPAIAQQFIVANVPVSDNRVGPFLQYHTYSKTYARLLDFDTLGLQEDFRLGHNVFANVYPAVKGLGSTRDFIGFDLAAQYTVQLGDGLVRAAVESITEVETSTEPGTGLCPPVAGRPVVKGPVCDASIEPALHIVSPTVLVGRFVLDLHLLYRLSNYLNQNEFLGGDTRLRGYPSNYFTGYDILDGNLEYRTRSVDILSAQVGLVAFYDVGQAWNGWGTAPGTLCRSTTSSSQSFCPVQGVGAGLRIVFPQFDRIVFRTDLGFPLGVGRDLPGIAPVAFFFSLGQAFTTPAVSPGAGTGSTVQLPQISGSPTTALSAPP